MRIQITKDVDPTTLADQLSAALGIPVALSSRNPGQKDNQGNNLPGVVVLIDPATGNELPDQDLTKVNAVIAAHTIPVPPPTPAQALSDALGAAGSNVGAVISALKSYAGTIVAQEAQQRRGRP
jgi:hypothetical protein